MRIKKSGEEVEFMMMSGHSREAWGEISRWYRKFKGHKYPPLREGLKHISEEREELYSVRQVPVFIWPEEVGDVVPD